LSSVGLERGSGSNIKLITPTLISTRNESLLVRGGDDSSSSTNMLNRLLKSDSSSLFRGSETVARNIFEESSSDADTDTDIDSASDNGGWFGGFSR